MLHAMPPGLAMGMDNTIGIVLHTQLSLICHRKYIENVWHFDLSIDH